MGAAEHRSRTGQRPQNSFLLLFIFPVFPYLSYHLTFDILSSGVYLPPFMQTFPYMLHYLIFTIATHENQICFATKFYLMTTLSCSFVSYLYLDPSPKRIKIETEHRSFINSQGIDVNS